MGKRNRAAGRDQHGFLLYAILSGMRTTLDLDDALMTALLERHPGISKTEAVERAIREYIHNDAAARLGALRGKLDIKDVSAESRRLDRERQERLDRMWQEGE